MERKNIIYHQLCIAGSWIAVSCIVSQHSPKLFGWKSSHEKLNCSETHPRLHEDHVICRLTITCGHMVCRLMIWILHVNYWTLSDLQENVFFQSQKMRSLAKWKSSKDCQLLELNEEIMKLNTETALLKSTTTDLQKRSDKLLLDAQKKQTLPEMRNEVTKANTLKSAASKKQ